MPLKKKTKKVKASTRIVESIEEESEYDGMDIEMLRDVVPMLRQQLQKCMLDRNYVQLEKDSIQQYFDITKREVDVIDLALAAKESEIEQLENNHKIQIKVYGRKAKQLSYEHQNNLNEIDYMEDHVTEAQSFEVEKQKSLQKSTEQMKFELLQNELQNSKKISEIKSQNEMQQKNLLRQFEDGLRELIIRCEARKSAVESEYELRRRVDIHELEERRNLHINELINNHQKSLAQMKEYYNKITSENLTLIKSLQSQIRELKARSEANKVALNEYKLENGQLLQETAIESSRMTSLQAQLKQRMNDKIAYKNSLSRQAEMENKLTIARSELIKLQQEYSSVSNEREQLCSTFEDVIQSLKTQSSNMNETLARKLKSLELNGQIASSDFNRSSVLSDVHITLTPREDMASVATLSGDFARRINEVGDFTGSGLDDYCSSVASQVCLDNSDANVDPETNST